MARPQSGETKAPVVIALAFFVLTTLALGVLTYLAYSDMEKLQADRAADVAAKDAAQKKQVQSDEKLLLLKSAIGIASEEDRTNLQNMREKEAVREEYTKLVTEIRNRIAGAVQAEARNFVGQQGQRFDMADRTVFDWDWPADGNLAAAPNTKPLLEQIVAYYAAQQLGQRKVDTELVQLKQQKDLATRVATQSQDLSAKLQAAYDAIPADMKKEADKYLKISQDTQKALGNETKKYTDDIRKAEADKNQLALDVRRVTEDLSKAQRLTDELSSRLEANDDPFEFDKPHASIVRRRGNIVEVNLGSRDNVKPGLKFAVQPSDTPERGFDARKRVVRTPDGRTESQIIAKGKIEIIQTLGDHLSQARIVEERDPVRDGILVGDLLYNSVWRKGEPDHIALVGIFDLNGDGSDDIKSLARDLTKMGIIVDAYYDLDQLKWVGKISEKTIYAVEGNVPFKDIQPGEPPAILEAKAAILKGITDARKEAKDRGSKLVRMRDFFPRVGYPVNLDVDQRQIDASAARYLKTSVVGEPVPGM